MSEGMGINIFDLPDKVVDEGQAAEHHAIIITDTYPEGLNREEMQLYMMIIGRMLEAFMPACQGGIHHRGCRMCRTKFPVSCMPHH